MIKNYESIRLFKKNRDTEDAVQELLTKEEIPHSEQQLPESIVKPLKFKDKEISLLTNSEHSLLPLRIIKVVQKALKILGIDRKGNFSMNSLKDRDFVRKLPIWSIFKKPL